jgi:hypothetical protein
MKKIPRNTCFRGTFYFTTGQPQWGEIHFFQNTGKKICPIVLAVQKMREIAEKEGTNIQLLRLFSTEHKKRIPKHYRSPFPEYGEHNAVLD